MRPKVGFSLGDYVGLGGRRRTSALPSRLRATSEAGASKNVGGNIPAPPLGRAATASGLMRSFPFAQLEIKNAAKKRKAHAIGDR